MTEIFDTNAEYHSSKAISASGLKSIIQAKGSVQEYLSKTYKYNKAYEFGNAVHTLFLEGRKRYEAAYYELPEIGNLTYKVNKELKAQLLEKAGDRIALDYKDVQTIREAERQFYANPLAVELCKGSIELSHYTEYEGVPVRVRPDCKNTEKQFISDIKTTKSVVNFDKDIRDYGYHIQAAFYCTILGFPIENFRFVVIKNNIQYDNEYRPEPMVDIVKLSDYWIERGFNDMRIAFDRWKHYIETGEALGAGLRDEQGVRIV